MSFDRRTNRVSKGALSLSLSLARDSLALSLRSNSYSSSPSSFDWFVSAQTGWGVARHTSLYSPPHKYTYTHTHKPGNAHWKIEKIEGSGGEEAFIHVLDSRSAHTLHQEIGKSRKPGTRAFTTAARRYHLLLVSSSVSPRESRMLAVISANYIRRAPFLLDAAVVAICLWKEIKEKKKET